MNKINFAILCNYVQSVATIFCLLLFPSISSYTVNMKKDQIGLKIHTDGDGLKVQK